MIFDGFPAKWFQGVKGTVPKYIWPRKPPYRVYSELFAEEHDSKIKNDLFIRKMRSIFAQLLSGTLMEEVQLDMRYGLLHRKIRNKIRNFN